MKRIKKEKIIFLEDTKWGKKFDKKYLKRGFVKYLLESKKIFFDNEKNRIILDNILKKEKKIFEKISKIILKFKLKVNEKDETFGAINLKNIINELNNLNFEVKENNFPEFSSLSGIGEKEVKLRIKDKNFKLKILIEKEV